MEIEIGGEIQHFEGTISPAGQTKDASNVIVATFDYDPAAGKKPEADEAPDVYAAYSDDVILGQWATVIPKENIMPVGDPKSIIDALLGALAIADGKTDLDGYLKDLGELGTPEDRLREVEAALSGLPSAKKVATAEVEGEVPAGPEGGKKRSVRL